MNKRFNYQSEGEKLSIGIGWWLLFGSMILLWFCQ